MADLKEMIQSGARALKFRYGPADWELVRIEPGEFTFGAPLDEAGREEGDLPPRRVRITKTYYLGKYQITQVQYRAVMGTNPARFKGDEIAVDQMKYSNALAFCSRLSKLVGVPVTLPTEAQWEYACRAGTNTPYYSGTSERDLDRIAWYRDNSRETVHRIGEKEPNAWGLYDMLGNVYEPCIDYITNASKLKSIDPEGQRPTTYSAARGGAWMEPAERCRAATRTLTDDMFGGLGIRIAIIV
jgi:formylglycine-generating enzyme required for sulfatase activity